MERQVTHIKLVEAEEIRPLRHKMLRQGQDYSTTSYLRDNEKLTFHLGVTLEEKIVSCATFYPEETNKMGGNNPYRLRGMATDSNYLRNGYGKQIMQEAFQILKLKKCNLLWCNARILAVPFYQSVGLQEIGDLFDIADIGPHYYMYKEIY
jgi:predicted GNAT family N-acyltransferase